MWEGLRGWSGCTYVLQFDLKAMGGQKRMVLIVGAGPAGLMAALQATKAGAEVTVLEHSKYACMKLGLTGKGRCNITNARPMEEFGEKVPQGYDFLRPAFAHYPNAALRRDLEMMGVPTLVERGDRVFPSNGNAQTVRRALIGAAERAGVELLTGVKGVEVAHGDGGFTAKFIDIKGAQRSISGDALILATGGMSYPSTGSDGSGYALARSFGHTVTRLCPSLVGLCVANGLAAAAGVELRNVKVALLQDGVLETEEQGEVLCTRDGFEGAAILRLSRLVTTAEANKRFELSIDFKPGLNRSKLRGRIARERAARPHEPLSSSLRALVPARLVLPIARRAKMPLGKGWADLQEAEVAQLIEVLKGMRFNVVGNEGFEQAVVTAGGVSLEEVRPETLESKLVPKLYFAGELLNVDANTGGFNLQIAFSTGALAGANSVVG